MKVEGKGSVVIRLECSDDVWRLCESLLWAA